MKFSLLKIFFLLVMIFSLPVVSFAADDSQSLFEKGNAYYSKNQFGEAIKEYSKVINQGYHSPAVYFNLGNAYYKEGELASALLYYEKAHLLSPGDEDINFNIRFANAKTTDKVEETPELFFSRWWKSFILSFSADGLAAAAIMLIILGSAALIWYFFSNSGTAKKIAFFGALTFFLLGIFSVFIAASQVRYFNNNKQAIVFSSVVNVKTSPADGAPTAFVLHDGTKVNLSDTTDNWVKISLANGTEGWLKLSDIKQI